MEKRRVFVDGADPLYRSMGERTDQLFKGNIDGSRFLLGWLVRCRQLIFSYLSDTWPLTGISLIAYYPFSDEGTGDNTCYDHSGYGRHTSSCVVPGSSSRKSGWIAPNCLPSTLVSTYCRDVAVGC